MIATLAAGQRLASPQKPLENFPEIEEELSPLLHSVVLERLIAEVRDERDEGIRLQVYDRMHRRHNRS